MKLTIKEVKLLKQVLGKKGITQASIARRLALGTPMVSRMLNGHTAINKRHFAILSDILPLNKKELSKGNFVFKKGVLNG